MTAEQASPRCLGGKRQCWDRAATPMDARTRRQTPTACGSSAQRLRLAFLHRISQTPSAVLPQTLPAFHIRISLRCNSDTVYQIHRKSSSSSVILPAACAVVICKLKLPFTSAGSLGSIPPVTPIIAQRGPLFGFLSPQLVLLTLELCSVESEGVVLLEVPRSLLCALCWGPSLPLLFIPGYQ